ncbi:hypothetical protein EDB89DRAFT_1990395 [Lactarius sanguifluus]|nr:hypothetical protein EDB89DRAFT_2006082 [Lactarius sanguifluus]KAH9168765.1 hypothetical protein EDB89DRAFT_1990395 [Lactarius sanguifluus]
MFLDMSRLPLATSTVYVASLVVPCCGHSDSNSTCSRPRQPLFELSRHAEACATVSDHLRPPALTLCVASPDFAALMRTLSPSTLMRPRSPQTRLRHVALRGGLEWKMRLIIYLQSIAPFLKERGRLERNVLDITAGKSPTSITYHLQYIKQKCLSSE